MGKYPWLSKTILVNALTLFASFLAAGSIPIDPVMQVKILAAINIILRVLSGTPIVTTAEKAVGGLFTRSLD